VKGMLERPDRWCKAKLGDISRAVRNCKPAEAGLAKFVYIDISSIDKNTNRIVSPKTYAVADAPSRARQLVEAGDILFSTVRTYLRNVAMVDENHHGRVASTGFCVIRIQRDLVSPFFFYYVLTNWFVEPLNELQRGTSYPAVRDGDVLSQYVPLPPILEQRAIVAKIEELFSELDKGIEQLQTAKQQLKRYRQAVLKAAFEGKLTAEWRAEQQAAGNLPHADELLEQIKREREERYEQQLQEWKQNVAEWEEAGGRKSGRRQPRRPAKQKKTPALTQEELKRLSILPKTWKWVPMAHLAQVGTGLTPQRGNEQYWADGCIPWIASAAANHPFCDEATDYVTQEAVDATGLKLFPSGTLLLAMYGEGKTRGKVTELRIPATINQALAAIIFEGVAAQCRPFNKYYLQAAYTRTREQSSGGVQPNLNLGIVNALAVPCAPVAEQKEIVQELESRLSVIDELDKAVDHGLEQAEALRQSILRKAFEGRLLSESELAAVRNDPEYEPADKLLARIRAEAK
jgi:type I restriction enzyme S subunit